MKSINTKPSKRYILYAALSALIAFVGIFSYAYISTYPARNPDGLLALENKVQLFFNNLTLPIKIARLSARQPESKILMPVYGRRVSEITDTWHAPRGADRVHEGQDIFAPKGTPILSATAGYVIGLNDDTLGGVSVYILGAGARRYYYTHLDRHAQDIQIGDEVTTDTIIGYVGNSGNAASTPPHLHFGVYSGRQAIDPLPLLINRS
jgi:murein DD-endopeptidase MepM/ murein hydrolase activator NlpD